MVLAGNLNSKFGILITVLKKKYTKFAINVAIPAPSSPIFGIKTIFKTIPTMPDISFKTKSI